jgi:hypothetical protein
VLGAPVIFVLGTRTDDPTDLRIGIPAETIHRTSPRRDVDDVIDS